MDYVDPQNFQEAIESIKNGSIFEKFICDFLAAVLGNKFFPMGGVHDLGIDGVYTTNEELGIRAIYQISIDNSHRKIKDTLAKLQKNNIECSELYFVTNKPVKTPEKIRTELFREYHILLTIYDASWLRGQVNSCPASIRVYNAFTSRYFHELQHIGKTRIISDFDGDPKIFIFLRQQLTNADSISDLRNFIIDNLILFSLEGTDPDKNILLTRDEIKKKIAEIAPFQIDSVLFQERLLALSTKPRKIKHHKSDNAYCLPYETRQKIQSMNIHDNLLKDKFNSSIVSRIANKLQEDYFTESDCIDGIISIFNTIFKNSGLEFSNFILSQGVSSSISKSLCDWIKDYVEHKYVATKQRKEYIIQVLQNVIRDVIYSPSSEEQEYLTALSKTYMTLFMLNVDPDISRYLTSMANGLEIFVCSSILIPALSESNAAPQNRRLWNLLQGASKTGVKFYITKTILDEIAYHIENEINDYFDNYQDYELLYSDSDMIASVDGILIRGYFYHKRQDNDLNFERYIDEFVDINASHEDKIYELKEFFNDTFGIEYYSDEREILKLIDRDDLETLTECLSQTKPSRTQAQTDAETILAIYAKRTFNKEYSNGGLGYRTWWLSTDTRTFNAVTASFRDKYQPSCYIRPDFLANFISLTPQAKDVEKAYDNIFPNTLGISLSRHIDVGFTKAITDCLKKYSNYNLSRVKTIIHSSIDRLKTEFQLHGKHGVAKYITNLYNDETFR